MRRRFSLVLTAWAAAAGAAHALQPDAQFTTLRAVTFAPTAAAAVNVPLADTGSPGGLTWFSDTRLSSADPAASRLEVATTAQRVTAGAVLGPQDADSLQPRGYDLTYTRGWPSAVSLAAGRFDLDLSPHAAVGMGDYGRPAEAGAMVRFGKNLQESVANRLNLKEGASFGAQSRWYVFAAASGRAVGLNMTSSEGDWRRAGMSQDNANALIGDAQAGVGWRKGPMTASVGYIRRDVKIRQGLEGLMGAGDRNDNLVALAFSIKPQF